MVKIDFIISLILDAIKSKDKNLKELSFYGFYNKKKISTRLIIFTVKYQFEMLSCCGTIYSGIPDISLHGAK